MAERKHIGGLGYLYTFVALLALASLSLGVSFFHLHTGELAIALLIASAKALLVLMLFMHLYEQRFSNRVVVIMSVLMIALLVSLTAVDVATRKTFPRSPAPLESDTFYRR